jgi:FkbM family methyltransferase
VKVDSANPAAGEAPWWVRSAGWMIRRLPAGRFRAAALIAKGTHEPFVARMSPDHGGARFWCDLADDIARDVCLVGNYEPQVSRVVTRLLSPGMTVVDAGANWGYFTLLAASLVGPLGRVLAFEPDPRVFDLLQRNLTLNRFPHVTALPLAAGRAAGSLTLDGYDADAHNRGISRVRQDGAPASATSFKVGAARMDDVVAERGIDVIDLVKIDVEGAEDAVLDGMRAGLRTGRYRRVLIELHPAILAERGQSPTHCCQALLDAGYIGWAFDHSPEAVRRAAYASSMKLSELLHRTDRVPPSDPWPHMLWTRPDATPL